MAKTFKTFTKAPTPGSLEAIEAYERGGLGHDTTKPQTHIHTKVSDHDTTEPQTHIHTNVADRDNHETTGPHSHEGGQNDEAPVHRYARQSAPAVQGGMHHGG